MSRVFRARSERDGTPAALKVVTPERARRPNFRLSFRRELHAMAALNHPGIVQIFDYGELTDEQAAGLGDDIPAGAPWLAMEYVEGRSLPTWPADWSWGDLRGMLLGLLDALAHAHARGVIHRDLKPSNLMVVEGNDGGIAIKVVDFGIARLVGGDSESDVPEVRESITGTPKYMAPEQIRGNWRNQGPWTDLYSVGCLAWRMITGRAPFVADESEDILRAHLQEGLPALEPRRSVPDAMQGWLTGLLEKTPDSRFGRAADAGRVLRRMEPPDGDHDGTGGDQWPEGASATTRVTQPSTGWDDLDEPPDTLASSSSVGEVDVVDWEPGVPIPDDWRRRQEVGSSHLQRAGLNLFPFRTIPFVGRDSERETMWSELRAVASSGRPQGRLLAGPSGLGKSRLASWLCRRSHELGAANVVRVHHRRLGNPGDGLARMLRRKFQCQGLDASEAISRIRRLLQRRFGVPSDVVLHDAALLASLMGDGAHQTVRPGRHHGPQQQRLALLRWLEGYGTHRPVVIWLDGVQWGRESLSVLRQMFRESDDRRLPVYAVATFDTDAGGRDSGAREVLEALLDDEHLDRTDLSPLGEKEHRDLIEELLEFRPELVRRIAEVTEGEPLHAIQMVTDWVERDRLVVGQRVVDARGDLDDLLSDDAADVWARRVETALADIEIDDRVARRCLEFAAVLGGVIDEREWRDVARRGGADVTDEVRDALLDRGLLEYDDRRCAFVHSGLRRRLVEVGSEAGRIRQAHRVCAETLAERYPEHPPRGRIGVHWLYAGEPSRALEPARRAARRAYRQRRYDDASYYLDIWRAASDAVDPDGERNALQARLLGAEIALGVGDAERARELIRGLKARASAETWRREEGRATTIVGRLLINRGELEEGQKQLRRAVDLLDKAGDSRGRARANLSLAEVSKRLGEFEGAETHYRRARRAFDAEIDAGLLAEIDSHLAYLRIARGEHERARELATEALDRARDARARTAEAHALTQLGEIARFEREWQDARDAYERAAALYRSSGSRNVVICRLNRAVSEIGAGRREKAGELFDALTDEIREAGLHFLAPVIDAGRACVVADGDAREWRRAWSRVDRHEREASGIEKDVAWLLERAGDIAEEAGYPERAADAFRRASVEWRALGDDEKADRAAERSRENAAG